MMQYIASVKYKERNSIIVNNIVVVNYGMGNLHSVVKKLLQFKMNTRVSSDPKEILKADKIILPGVGNFKRAVENLKKLELWDALNEYTLEMKKPILGICLGMQLMAKFSEEGDSEGFGWIDASVLRFNVKDKIKYKVPHTGWNQISIIKESLLMKDIPENSEFYFVHSYHYLCLDETDVLNLTQYEYSFPSAIEKQNIFGVQYHPEKSHDVGELLLGNFLRM